LVRRVFGEIAAKEFVSVQPMNLPSGLVFYLDFKYGTNVTPFTSGGSLYGANASTNVTDIASQSLYGAGKFGYSINHTSSIVVGTTGSVSWADFNFDSDYVVTGSYRKITFTLPSTSDNLGVRGFTLSGNIYTGSAANTVAVSSIAAGDVLSAFTTISGTTVTMFFSTSSVAINASSSQTVLTASYFVTPQNASTVGTSRGDFEDTSFNVGTPGISIPEIN